MRLAPAKHTVLLGDVDSLAFTIKGPDRHRQVASPVESLRERCVGTVVMVARDVAETLESGFAVPKGMKIRQPCANEVRKQTSNRKTYNHGLNMKSIVILISGRGSNMEVIVDACQREGWPARISAVISNKPDAAGLQFAASRGIPTETIDHTSFTSREAFDAELARVIDEFKPDVVVLAGFMRILTEGFVRRFEGRLLNIHPSLLPAFPGLHTHQRAIAAGCKLAGATVHCVTPELDHGPIVMQAAVPVHQDDTPATLAARVLAQEHIIYPRSVRWFVEGRLLLADGVVHQVEGQPQINWGG